jgi:hypothetical protein
LVDAQRVNEKATGGPAAAYSGASARQGKVLSLGIWLFPAFMGLWRAGS